MTAMSDEDRRGEPWLELHGISKRFGGVQSLRSVDLTLHTGEVHALVGANGAGKSTLVRILAGAHPPDAGEIRVDGEAVTIGDPQQATQLGFSFIHQELNLVPRFDAVQNITLGLKHSKRFGLVNWRGVQREIQEVVDRLRIDFRLDVPVAELSVAEQWLIAIGRALMLRSRLIAMDEPTASLSAAESERLFSLVRELSRDGISILYVSHRLDELLELCQEFTVLRNGERMLSAPRSEMDRARLVRAIAGADVARPERVEHEATDEETVLEVRGLCRGSMVRDVSFELRRGEVLGLAGLVGAGRTEVARMIFGADRPDAGTMYLGGREFKPRKSYDAIKRGIGLVPEERRSEALVLNRSVRFNIDLPSFQTLRSTRWWPVISGRRSREWASKVARELDIRTPSVETTVGQLSGGNQQKVVIGKWLRSTLQVLILDEPTRGVDVGARAEIYRIIREFAAKGAGVLVISSDNEELPGLCDRVLVMVEGRIAEELAGSRITQEALLSASYAHEESQLHNGGSQ
jgi:ribose transport system ATP-binding protein